MLMLISSGATTDYIMLNSKKSKKVGISSNQ